jgi:hypothetical protein
MASPYESAPVYPGGMGSTVISMSDFNNMTMMSTDRPPNHAASQRKAALRKQSQNRYKNWGNTLEALRDKKKKDRVRRLEQIEAAQRVIDQEEASYQEQQRRAAVDRANRLQFQDCERVKTFQTALSMANTLKERQAQIMINRRKKVAKAKEDQMWFRIQEDNIKAQIAREEQEELRRQEKSKGVARMQLEQLAEVRERQKQARIEEILDGERNKAIAKEAVEEAEEMERLRIARMKENNMEYMRANIEQQKIKDERRKLEEQEEKKIAEYAAEQERLENLRKENELAKFKQKQARFEAMLSRQHAHLKALRDAETNRVEEQVKQVKERDDALFQAEQERIKRQQEATQLSRQRQLERKRQEAERERMEDEVMAMEFDRRKQLLDQRDLEVERKTTENNIRNQQVLKGQMVEKRLRAREARLELMEEAATIQQQKQVDDQIFMDYAQQCINDFASRGRTVVPMKLALAKTIKEPLTAGR